MNFAEINVSGKSGIRKRVNERNRTYIFIQEVRKILVKLVFFILFWPIRFDENYFEKSENGSHQLESSWKVKAIRISSGAIRAFSVHPQNSRNCCFVAYCFDRFVLTRKIKIFCTLFFACQSYVIQHVFDRCKENLTIPGCRSIYETDFPWGPEAPRCRDIRRDTSAPILNLRTSAFILETNFRPRGRSFFGQWLELEEKVSLFWNSYIPKGYN